MGAAADAGFKLIPKDTQKLSWLVADLLMPPGHDQDLLREHAEQDMLTPSTYMSSFFPVERERAVGVGLSGDPRKALLAALFFFKSLGFTKPEDSIVRLLGKCPAHDYRVFASMGPKGLTRLVLRMTTPEHEIAEELAGSAGFLYKAGLIESLQNDLQGSLPQVVPDFVDFTAEYRGY